MSTPSNHKSATLDCPHGDSACPIYDEINTLNQTVTLLKEQAHTDALTGLYNNRHFQITLTQEIERTQRTGVPTSLMMVDVDHFKRINDTHGHLAGDKVLKHLATLLQNSLRKLDIPCRYGGEEFAVLLPSTPLLVAAQVAERLRLQISDTRLAWEGLELSITASIGVGACNDNTTETKEEFVGRIDKQLYRAKREGRNRICAAPQQPSREKNVSAIEKEALNP